VRFLGKVSEEDLYRWFASTDVYVSLSSNEAMPVTFIECLAAGARVVASEIPAHQDLVEKTRGSIRLVGLDASDETIARAIDELAAEPAAQARIDTWDDVAIRTAAVYDELHEQSTQARTGNR
jgi:glycosyltransferase involved in cell wall biosynthesis